MPGHKAPSLLFLAPRPAMEKGDLFVSVFGLELFLSDLCVGCALCTP